MFVPLKVKSSFSLLQSTTKINDLVQNAKSKGYSALALTDNNTLYGAIDFYNACRKAGIKPIIGLTLDISGLVETEHEYELTFIAKNKQGYQNLMQLSTLKMTLSEGTLTWDKLVNYLDGLFMLSPSEKSEFSYLIQQSQISDAKELLTKYQNLIGSENVRVGLSHLMDTITAQSIKALVSDFDMRVIALDEVNYLEPENQFDVEVLQAINDGATISADRFAEQPLGVYSLRNPEEITKEYQELSMVEAIQETQNVADETALELTFSQPKLPEYPLPDNETAHSYLRKLCISGLYSRFPNGVSEEYKQRLNLELSVIQKMGFEDYFLIVWDIMNYAHSQQIITGPGRGSSAGSLTAYTLTITDVDPIEYNLLFERFLNSKRVQMPDIDLDIPDDKRGMILDYLHQKYGHYHMAQIITFGTMAAKQALRDVGRVFGISPFEMKAWSEAIPNVLKITLTDALTQSQKLRNLVNDSPKNKGIFTVAQHIEGIPRHYSTHAAGVVLSQIDLREVAPLQNGSDDILLTQYSKDLVENVGLLKIDILGLRNLNILDQAVTQVKKNYQADFNPALVNLEDEKTLALFRAGDTSGVFQFESSGIKNVLKKLQPTSFEDVAAVNALYRPGPMENIDTFIARKHGLEKITFPDDSLKQILEPTYGVLVYQEQVMQVASKMGNFTLGEADLLRRAMSKKKKVIIDEMRTQFINGAQDNGIQENVAKTVYSYIEQFANYGFNRSHAVAYSKIAFQLAYIKANFSAAFFEAILNSVGNNPQKIKDYLVEAKQYHVTIKLPDINVSEFGFSLKKNVVLFGLSSVKGLRKDFIEHIITLRQEAPFTDFQAFLHRIDKKYLNEANISALIYSGCFDHFEYNRAELISALPELISSIDLSGNNTNLFELLTPKIVRQSNFPLMFRLEKEAQYLGAYLSGHPVEKYRKQLSQSNLQKISEISEKKRVTILVNLTRVKVIRTKKGQQMAFVNGSDETSEIDLTLFPDLFRQKESLLEKNKIVVVSGDVETSRGLQIIVKKIDLVDDYIKQATHKKWFLKIAKTTTNEKIEELMQLMKMRLGQTPVILYYEKDNRKISLDRTYWLRDDEETHTALTSMLGSENVVIK
ncbi:DNA polymerase III subunit alpha [Dellaglioa sp. BT-FLS60]